jgi:hypothetical protein
VDLQQPQTTTAWDESTTSCIVPMDAACIIRTHRLLWICSSQQQQLSQQPQVDNQCQQLQQLMTGWSGQVPHKPQLAACTSHTTAASSCSGAAVICHAGVVKAAGVAPCRRVSTRRDKSPKPRQCLPDLLCMVLAELLHPLPV